MKSELGGGASIFRPLNGIPAAEHNQPMPRLPKFSRLDEGRFMCGRFTQQLSWAELHRLADLIGQPRNLAPRYNISPTTAIEVIRVAGDANELVPMRWGLVPVLVEEIP